MPITKKLNLAELTPKNRSALDTFWIEKNQIGNFWKNRESNGSNVPRTWKGLPPPFLMNSLPLELVQKIGSLLPPKDYIHFKLTCKRFSALSQHPFVSWDVFRGTVRLKCVKTLAMEWLEALHYPLTLRLDVDSIPLSEADLQQALLLVSRFGQDSELKWLMDRIKQYHALKNDPGWIRAFNKALTTVVELGSLKMFTLLIQHPLVDPTTNGNYPVFLACRNGYLPILETLLKDARVSPCANHNEAFRWACENGHVDIVDKLLQDNRVDPADNDNDAIVWAAWNGHPSTVERLLKDPRVNPAAQGHQAIIMASQFGSLPIVKALLVDGRADPSAHHNQAFMLAVANGYDDLVALLLTDPRVNPFDNDYEALERASMCDYKGILNQLLNDTRLDAQMKSRYLQQARIPSVFQESGRVLADFLGSSSDLNALCDATSGLPLDDQHALKWAVMNGHAHLLKNLLAIQGVDPAVDDNFAFRMAVLHDRLACVRLLLNDPRVDPTTDLRVMDKLFKYEHEHMMLVLLKDGRIPIDPVASNHLAFRLAAESGCADLVARMLLNEDLDPCIDRNVAIRAAAAKGHLNVVACLLEDDRVDPSALDNYAVRMAAQFGHEQVVQLLMKDPRVSLSKSPRDFQNLSVNQLSMVST